MLRGEHRKRVFGNVVQRRMFEPEREGVAGGWISL
jgi:hypothetical protein